MKRVKLTVLLISVHLMLSGCLGSQGGMEGNETAPTTSFTLMPGESSSHLIIQDANGKEVPYELILKNENGDSFHAEPGMEISEVLELINETQMVFEQKEHDETEYYNESFTLSFVKNAYFLDEEALTPFLHVVWVRTPSTEAPLGIKVGDELETMVNLYGEAPSFDLINEHLSIYQYHISMYLFTYYVEVNDAIGKHVITDWNVKSFHGFDLLRT